MIIAYDVHFLTKCDHFVEGKQYRADMCKRCYGKGFYFDVMFDRAGEVLIANGELKLQQEVIKVLLDERTSDLFYPLWGSEIYTFIGKKNSIVTRSRLEMCIRRAIERLKAIQEHEAMTNSSVTDDEVVDSIDYIELEPVSVTEWRCKVTVSSKANQAYEYMVSV